MREPGDETGEAEADGDWLTSCIPSDLDAVNLHSRRITYSSIYRYKGLEASAVVITDVDALDTPAQRSLLYVGCTRALQRLVILAHEKVREQLVVLPPAEGVGHPHLRHDRCRGQDPELDLRDGQGGVRGRRTHH